MKCPRLILWLWPTMNTFNHTAITAAGLLWPGWNTKSFKRLNPPILNRTHPTTVCSWKCGRMVHMNPTNPELWCCPQSMSWKVEKHLGQFVCEKKRYGQFQDPDLKKQMLMLMSHCLSRVEKKICLEKQGFLKESYVHSHKVPNRRPEGWEAATLGQCELARSKYI